ncbi:MAG: TSUP family transporter [Campylobacteraceae bacterium]|nr:TSUP family transporter [Campylobacteraceae bacterium]
MCPLVFLAGFIDAIAGGGGLISIPAYLFAGLPPHFALGTNKLSSTIGTTVAALRYYKNGFVGLSVLYNCCTYRFYFRHLFSILYK